LLILIVLPVSRLVAVSTNGAGPDDDVLRRGTTLALTGRDSDAVRARVEALLAS
jgi:hypothetical protein